MRADLGDVGIASDTHTAWLSEHWTVNDMDAMDAIGPEVFWQWVERGYAGG